MEDDLYDEVPTGVGLEEFNQSQPVDTLPSQAGYIGTGEEIPLSRPTPYVDSLDRDPTREANLNWHLNNLNPGSRWRPGETGIEAIRRASAAIQQQRQQQQQGPPSLESPALRELRDLAYQTGDPHVTRQFAQALQEEHAAAARRQLNQKLAQGDFTQSDAIQLQKYEQGKAWVKDQLRSGRITNDAAEELLSQMAEPAAALAAQKQLTEKKKQDQQQQMEHQKIAKMQAINQQNLKYEAMGMEDRISAIKNPMTGETEYYLNLGPGKAPHRVFDTSKTKPAKEEPQPKWTDAEHEARGMVAMEEPSDSPNYDHAKAKAKYDAELNRVARELYNQRMRGWQQRSQKFAAPQLDASAGEAAPIKSQPSQQSDQKQRALEILRTRGAI